MRVLRFLFTSALLFSVLAVAGAFLGREALLAMGTTMIRSALTSLHTVSLNGIQYAQECRTRGGSGQSLGGIQELRLRFINNTQFVTEVVCDEFSSDPIVIKSYSLPPFVKKLPGQSGIIWGKERSGVEITIFGRTRIVAVENEEVKTYSGGAISLGVAPQSTCEGHGYMCCQQETLSGVGQPFTDVTDCPRACYSQCLARPLILSLNTDPFADDVSKVVSTSNGQPVDFSYVAAYQQKDPVTITLDFGDGEQETFTTLNGKTSHVYACQTRSCEFTAQLLAKTSQGVDSAMTPITQVRIRVE